MTLSSIRHRSQRFTGFALGALLFASACSPPTEPVDSATPHDATSDSSTPTDSPSNNDSSTGNDATVGSDSSTDASPSTDSETPSDAGSLLFANCRANSDCGTGTSVSCMNVFPGGLCTRRCTNSSQCGSSGICFQNFCFPSCDPSADDCLAFGSVCFGTGDGSDHHICSPSCYATPTTGVLDCNSSTSCDPYTGACSNTPSTGARNGEPCTMDGDCRSARCIPEVDDMGVPSGFVGGYCVSVGRQVSDVTYNDLVGMPLPGSNCPPESIVLPTEDPLVEGAPTICWARCDDATPCRAGYVCDHLTLTDGSNAFTTGACLPMNCADPANAAMANSGCPTGTHCVVPATDAGMPTGTCAPGAG